MKRGSGAARLGLLAAVCIATLTACHEGGLPDRNLPLQEARHREFRYPAYQPVANNPQIALAGRHWARSLPVESIPDRLLVPVGSADGTPLYALRGARAPYSRLYSPVGDGRWVPYLRLN
jgi:hypothetical protein